MTTTESKTADSRSSLEDIYSDYTTVQAMVAYRWLPAGLDSILEIGCSSGYFTKRIADKARVAHGADVNRNHIEAARARYPHLHFHVLEGGSLPFDDNSFDAVVMLEVYEHVEDRPALIGEVHRILRPGGLLILSTPNKGAFAFLDTFNLKVRFKRFLPGLFRFIERRVFRYQNTQFTDNLEWHPHFSVKEVREALEGGFQIQRVHRGGLLLFPVLALFRSVLIRVWPNPFLFKGIVNLMNIDGRVPYGTLAYNLEILAQKKD